MSRFRSLLGKMRGRLGMYTGTTSLTKMAAFLRGYDLAMIEDGERDDLMERFRNWIQDRCGTSKKSWEALILEQSANEEDAVQRFYQLLDEFLISDFETPMRAQTLPPEVQTTQSRPTKAI